MSVPQNEPQPQPGAPDPRAWIEHIPPNRRSTVANWFHQAVRTGATTPAETCRRVSQTVQERQQERGAGALDPTYQPFLQSVLAHLYGDPAGALAYAQDVIAYEALPYAERQKVKGRRALAYAMRGKPTTEAQIARIRREGYTGAIPADRSEASALIETLLRKKGGAA